MSSVKAAPMDTFMSLRPEFTPSNLGCIEVDLIVKNESLFDKDLSFLHI